MQEIDMYQRCLPHLKTSMRGAGWEDSHWLQLFKMVGLKTEGTHGVSKVRVRVWKGWKVVFGAGREDSHWLQLFRLVELKRWWWGARLQEGVYVISCDR
eukprot:259694-Chlamydomonas_euryale.AAC.2